MSRANVDLLRKQIDAYRRGDWDDMAAILDPHTFIRLDRRWPEQFAYGRGSHRVLPGCVGIGGT
jgi:hypothetical protein